MLKVEGAKEVIYILVVFIYLCGSVIQDLRTRKIKNMWNLVWLGVSFLCVIFLKHIGMKDFFVGILAAFAVGFLCWKIRAFHAGDAKMFCVLGGFMGWQLVLVDYAVTFVLGAVIVGLFALYKKLAKKEFFFPFSIMITVSTALTLLFRSSILTWITR